jgi:hypothetical protein
VSFVGKADEHPVRKIISQLKMREEIGRVDLDAIGEVKQVRVDHKRPTTDERQPVKAERPSHHERAERPARPERTERVERPARSERPTRQEHEDRSKREHTKHQQSNRSVHETGTPKPATPSAKSHEAAKPRHKRRNRKIGV